MLSRKVFLGTVDDFRDDENALSIKGIEDIFYLVRTKESDFVPYTYKTNSIGMEDRREHRIEIVKFIFEADVCIIDVTPKLTENKNGKECIDFLLETCHRLNKKVIYLYNKKVGRISTINDLYKGTDLREETDAVKRLKNDLGVFPHNGNYMENEDVDALSNTLNNFFEQFPKYKKTRTVSLQTGNINDFINILENWMQDYDLSRNDYYHIYYEPIGNIQIMYQGYNAITYAYLNVDLDNLEETEIEFLINDITEYFKDEENFYIHERKNKKLVQ